MFNKDPSKELLLSNKESGIPIMNISEHILSTNPSKQKVKFITHSIVK